MFTILYYIKNTMSNKRMKMDDENAYFAIFINFLLPIFGI